MIESNIDKVCSKLRTALTKEKGKIISLYSEEIQYSQKDIHLLWADLDNFLMNFPSLDRQTKKKWELEKTFYNEWMPNSEYVRIPWGRVLICSPSNSIIPLLPIHALSFCSSGNELIIAPSRKGMKTAELVFNTIQNVTGEFDWKMKLYTKGGASAISEHLENFKQRPNLLYFQGSSKSRIDIYSKCIKWGIDLIYEGEGNQITIIDSIPEGWEMNNIVSSINSSKEICLGQLCTTPNTLFINENFSESFINEYNQTNKTENLNFISKLNELGVETLSEKINKELFSTQLNIIQYSDFSMLLNLLSTQYEYGLQVSIFTNKFPFLKDTILEKLHFSRLTYNMTPTIQNSLLPWGGYKKSGFSPVVNFIEKATKPVIIESL